MYKRILVTGAKGYIGSELVPKLRQKYQNAEIIEYDLLNDCDVLDKDKLKEACSGVDCCIHLAAEVNAESSVANAQTVWDTNFKGTLNVLNFLRAGTRFIFPSTTNIYGKCEQEMDETANPLPVYPYANSKLAAEQEIKNSEVEWTILRLSTNYGISEKTRYNLVINKLTKLAVEKKPVTIYGIGDEYRPFIHVKDTVNAILFILDEDKSIKEIYNVGGENYKIRKLITQIAITIPEDVTIKYLKNIENPFSYKVKFNKIEKLGFKRTWSIKKGIKELYDELRK